MELIYYPNHDKRYAHIHPLDRRDYPDEIRMGHPPLVWVIKRRKNYKELTAKDVRGCTDAGIPGYLFAKDVPVTEWRY